MISYMMQRYQILVLSLVLCLCTCMVIFQNSLNNDFWTYELSYKGRLTKLSHKSTVGDLENLEAKTLKKFSDDVKNRLLEIRYDKIDLDGLRSTLLMKHRFNFLNRTRNSINYRSILQTFNPLLGLPVIDGKNGKVVNVLLVTYFRTGSSFVGDLLQQNWKSFYSFEPFHYMKLQKKLDRKSDEETIDVLKNVYKCDFYPLNNYLRWVEKPENRFLFQWNRFLWSLCSLRRPECFSPKVIGDTCSRSMYRVVKTTRLSLRAVEKLLDKLGDEIDLKVVYLIRDPRAMLSSRRKLVWCSNSECSDIETMCSEMSSDLSVYNRLHAKYGDKVIALRHEDLALRPTNITHDLFAKLSLPFSPRVRRFLRINTRAKIQPNVAPNPYSIKRNSKKVITQWTYFLNSSDILLVQEKCKKVLSKLGYKPLNVSDNFNLTQLAPEDLLELRPPLSASIF